VKNINSKHIESPRLSQAKFYLKIIGIPYLNENSNVSILSDYVETIIKFNHVFNNLSLASKLWVIKALPKSDIAIIWINIWNAQSRFNAKNIINRSFNIGSYIATIWGINMNSGVPQYKNCWKWKHIIFSCRIQGDKYIKYNGLHKSKHHRYFTWCCKANPKTNSSRLETKQDKLCLHSFKCSNYQGDYQADSNYYLF